MKAKRKVAVSKAKAPALVLDPRNAKKHGERNKKLIRQSLESVGPFRSIGAVRGVVKVGNGVFEAAQGMGLKVKRVKADRDTLVVVDRDDLTDAEADRAAMLDNIAADSSAFDYEAARFAELVEGDALLKQMASEEAKYRELLKGEAKQEPVDPGELIDKAAELQEKWQVKRGDIWTAGRHRLMCGDSTSKEDVARLMDGKRAQLVVTSPPYWVGKDYESQGSETEIDAFIQLIVAEMVDAVSGDCGRIVINTGTGMATAIGEKDSRVILLVDKWTNCLLSHGWKLRHIRHWIKGGGQGFPHRPVDDFVYSGMEYLLTYYRPGAKQRGQNRVSTEWAQQSNWNDIKGDKQENEAGFPVELPARFIELYALSDEIVFEPFTGNGTTLVACEQTGRIGYGMEIEPKYCAVSLERLSLLGLTCERVG